MHEQGCWIPKIGDGNESGDFEERYWDSIGRSLKGKRIVWGGDFNLGGEYHDYNIVKLAEHYMKKGFYKSALEVLAELLHSSHPSMVTMFFLPLNRLNRAPIQLKPKETLKLRSLDFILTLLGNIGPVLGTFLELPNLQCLIIWGNYSFKIYKR